MTQDTENANDIIRNVLIALGVVLGLAIAFAAMVAIATPATAAIQEKPETAEAAEPVVLPAASSEGLPKPEKSDADQDQHCVVTSGQKKIWAETPGGYHKNLDRLWQQQYLQTISPLSRPNYAPPHRYESFAADDIPEDWHKLDTFWEILKRLQDNRFVVATYGRVFMWADCFKQIDDTVVKVQLRQYLGGPGYSEWMMTISCTTDSESAGAVAVGRVAQLFGEFDDVSFTAAADPEGTISKYNDKVWLKSQKFYRDGPVHTALSVNRQIVTKLVDR